MKTGMKKSKFDDSIFYWYNNKLEGLICCRVDDFFWGGTKHFAESVINRLKENFLICLKEFENFKYILLNLGQKDNCVYQDELKEVVIPKTRKMSRDSPITTDEARHLSGLAGQLNWTSSQTHPDMSFGACEVSTSIKNAQTNDLLNANMNIRKLELQQILLQFPNLMGVEECNIICFVDADFANLKNSSPQGGYIVFLCKDQKKYAPIS